MGRRIRHSELAPHPERTSSRQSNRIDFQRPAYDAPILSNMKPIAIFYHCLFYLGEPPKFMEASFPIVREQMQCLDNCGLLEAAQELEVGINGGLESWPIAAELIPKKATIRLHGLKSRNENSTLRLIEDWAPTHKDWNVLYFHAKGATHTSRDPLRENWRSCMMRNLVSNWKQCVIDLDSADAVGCHWMTGDQTPPGQSIFAGNFWWATSDYLATIPSMLQRERIKVSGIHAPESRYESEVWIGNGSRFPKIKDYHPAWIDTCTKDAP